MSQQRDIRRQIDRVPTFTLAVTGEPDGRGRTDCTTSGRSAARSKLATVLGQPLPPQTTALLLAGGDSDQAAILGYAPFLTG